MPWLPMLVVIIHISIHDTHQPLPPSTTSMLLPPNTRMRCPRPTPPQPPQLPPLGIKQTLDPPQPRHDIPILLLPCLLLLLIASSFLQAFPFQPHPCSTRGSRPLRRLRHQPLRNSRRRNATLAPPVPHPTSIPRFPTPGRRRFDSLPDKSLIPQPQNQHLPPRQLALPFGQRPGARVPLRRGCLPGTVKAVLAQRVEVVHWCGDEDLGRGGVDLAGLEEPEAEAAEAGVAGGGVGDGGVQGRVGQGLPA